jgi:hypothetical protein
MTAGSTSTNRPAFPLARAESIGLATSIRSAGDSFTIC